jgi:steroid delta-isomerase-like uncharacterized protein
MTQILQIVTELVAAWNAHDLERAVTFYAPDYEGVDVDERIPHQGHDGVRRMLQRYWNAFPDLQFTGEETIMQGNRIAMFWRACGTQLGPILRIPATGRKINTHGVSLLTIEAGKVKHGRYLWDVAGMLRDLGLLPEP